MTSRQSRRFANPGWFDGHMGTIVGYVVDALIEGRPRAKKEEPHADTPGSADQAQHG